jgi:hypothetical protein
MNPFASWTAEQVKAHNERIVRKSNPNKIGPSRRQADEFERPVGDEQVGSVQAPPRSATRCRVRILSRRVRLLDLDNLYGGVKPYCDALRYAQAIRDDSPDAIELEVVQERVVKGEECTIIEIIPL